MNEQWKDLAGQIVRERQQMAHMLEVMTERVRELTEENDALRRQLDELREGGVELDWRDALPA